jgi:hypothetical protein
MKVKIEELRVLTNRAIRKYGYGEKKAETIQEGWGLTVTGGT